MFPYMVIVDVRAIIWSNFKHSTLRSYHLYLLPYFWEILDDELTRRSKLITLAVICLSLITICSRIYEPQLIPHL